jgi:hypothetical protein
VLCPVRLRCIQSEDSFSLWCLAWYGPWLLRAPPTSNPERRYSCIYLTRQITKFLARPRWHVLSASPGRSGAGPWRLSRGVLSGDAPRPLPGGPSCISVVLLRVRHSILTGSPVLFPKPLGDIAGVAPGISRCWTLAHTQHCPWCIAGSGPETALQPPSAMLSSARLLYPVQSRAPSSSGCISQ